MIKSRVFRDEDVPFKRIRKRKESPAQKRQKRQKYLHAVWSVAVRTRDHYTCQYCGLESKMTQAHHIFSATNGSTRYDLDNGITLCWRCHFFIAHNDGHNDLYWFIEHEWMGEKRFEALHDKAKHGDHIVKFTDAYLDGVEKYLREEIDKLSQGVCV